MTPHLRIARPVSDLDRSARMYCEGLRLDVIGRFENHDGFDGVMLGRPGAGHHFEFTVCRHHRIQPSPGVEDLVVLYLPQRQDWEAACRDMLSAGFQPVESFNPYWDAHGRTFVDPDGYRVVLQQAAWGAPQAAATPPVEPRASVERARVEDIPHLVGLMHEFYAESGHSLDADWAEASFHALLSNESLGGAWIAREGKGAAGHVVLALAHSMEFGGPAGRIDDLFVRPASRRRGVAAALLGALLADCESRNVRAVQVEVGPENAAALALYRKLGLARVEGREHWSMSLPRPKPAPRD